MLSFSPTRGVLLASGLGLLIRDIAAWQGVDNLSKVVLLRAEVKWKTYIKTAAGNVCPAGTRAAAPAFGGCRPADFHVVIHELTVWLKQVDEIGVQERVARTLAVTLALRDVDHWSHMEGGIQTR